MTESDSHASPTPGWARVAVLVPALVALGSSTVGAQTASLGPLETSEQNPLYRLFYVPRAEPADVTEEGRFRLDVSAFYSNVFERSRSLAHDQIFDLEQMTNDVTLRYGARPGLEVGAGLGFQTTWGGFLDPVVDGFHDAFGLPNGGRETEPQNQFQVELEKLLPRVRFRLSPRTFGLEDARLFAKWRLLGSDRSSRTLSVRGTFRLAAGPVDPGRADGALAVLGRFSFEPVHLHAALGGTTLNAPSSLDPIVSGSAAFYTLALEGRLTPGLALVGQFAGASRYVGGFEDGELDRMANTLALGFRGGEEWAWQFGFAEDVPPNSPSVDFTVHVQIGRDF